MAGIIKLCDPVNACHTEHPFEFLRREFFGSRVVSALDSGAEGPAGSNRSCDAVG